MRETSKLLAATALTICLTLIPGAAAAAGAGGHRSSGSQRDHRQQTSKCQRRRSSCDGASADTDRRDRRSTKPKASRSHKATKAPKTPAATTTPAPPTQPQHQLHGRRRTRELQEVEEGEGSAQSQTAIAAALSTPCENTEITPAPGNVALVRSSVLCLINKERAEHGVAPLRTNADLEAAAEGHCAELIADDYFAHVAPDGETPVQRIERAGYIPGPSVGYVIGENLAWGTYQLSTPQSIVAAWIASPGHLANILESRYTETGIGVTPSVPQSLGEGNPGATYAQEFGVIIQ